MLLWSRHFTENDAYNTACTSAQLANCPEAKGPDFDFGQPPILVQLGGQNRALVIAQKSGMVHAIDPDRKGAVLWQKRASKGGYLGGSQWGSASDGEKIYVATSDVGLGGVADPASPGGFRLFCLRSDHGKNFFPEGPHECFAAKPHVNAGCRQLDCAQILAQGSGSGDYRIHEINRDLGELRSVVISIAKEFEIQWHLLPTRSYSC